MNQRARQSSGFAGKFLQFVDRLLGVRGLKNLPEEKREEFRAELEVLRQMAIESRTPRIAIVRTSETQLSDFIEDLFGRSVRGDAEIKEKLGRGRWYPYETDVGGFEILDLCVGDGKPNLSALERQSPDLVISIPDSKAPLDEQFIEQTDRVVSEIESIWGTAPCVISAMPPATQSGDSPAQIDAFYRQKYRASSIPEECWHPVPMESNTKIAQAIVTWAPPSVRVELARLVSDRTAKRRVAESVVRASSGINGTVAAVPFPFADMVPITGVQLMMVGTIARISGRRFNLRTIGQFLGAAGLNLGVGYVFRKFVRALIQFVPVAGSVVSAGIASAGTFAIGKAATVFFVGRVEDEPYSYARARVAARERDI